ncbi:hypothetical protein BDN70DRAFT_877870 [Pholiota conissans]|uniref:Transcription elongation factor Eaf N-terminal domain-containing protein n=1 Tax=Pholiota conissans TaxID=109636 RepID=A0A9P5Z337_9AGAR|nr:hypothetical protein BDN70DRAFT_877870 [Pholiota conissans]
MATTSSWTPPPGRHAVNIGSSLHRAIKNRKLKGSPAPTTKRSNLPERDFYSFKFNFKNKHIDASQPASLKKGTDNASIQAEFPGDQLGEAYSFNGTEHPARDVECMLIYDEDTGQYTLEKLESYVTLRYNRKVMVSPRSASPALSAAGKGKAKQEDYETTLPVKEEEEEGEADVDDLDELLRQTIADEPEEGEEIELPRKPISPPKPQPPPPPAKARPTKPLPQSRVELPSKVSSPPAPPPVAAPASQAPHPKPSKPMQAKPKKTKAAPPPPPSPPNLYPDEEVIELPKPSKRARLSPPQPPQPPPRARSPVSLSLPGGSTPAFAPPPAPVVSKPVISRNIPAPIPPPPQPVMPASPPLAQADSDDDDDDDDEDWEQIPTATTSIPQAEADYEASLEQDIFGGFGDDDGGEDIDANDLEQMMNEQLDSDDDEMVPVLPEPDRNAKPMSLNEMVTGVPAVDSDDDYSSSDESDDD